MQTLGSALNRQTRFEYDPVGNLTNVVCPTVTLAYTFDALNRLTNMVDAVGTNRFRYHENGLLTAEDGPWDADTVSFDYGTSRLRSRLTLLQPNASDWVQDNAYDAARRLTNVVSPAGAFGYDYLPGVTNGLTSASSLIRKLTLPGGGYITNTFAGRGQPCRRQQHDHGHRTLNGCRSRGITGPGNCLRRFQLLAIAVVGTFRRITYRLSGRDGTRGFSGLPTVARHAISPWEHRPGF